MTEYVVVGELARENRDMVTDGTDVVLREDTVLVLEEAGDE
jgi:hypothetical protein